MATSIQSFDIITPEGATLASATTEAEAISLTEGTDYTYVSVWHSPTCFCTSPIHGLVRA